VSGVLNLPILTPTSVKWIVDRVVILQNSVAILQRVFSTLHNVQSRLKPLTVDYFVHFVTGQKVNASIQAYIVN